MNTVIMMGRLTKDPDVRHTDKTVFAMMSIAVDRRFKKEGEPEADFFNCNAFGKTAEFAEKYLRKGTKIILSGRVQNDNYEKDGQKMYGTKIIIDSLEFAESKKAENDAPSAPDGFMPAADLPSDLPFLECL